MQYQLGENKQHTKLNTIGRTLYSNRTDSTCLKCKLLRHGSCFWPPIPLDGTQNFQNVIIDEIESFLMFKTWFTWKLSSELSFFLKTWYLWREISHFSKTFPSFGSQGASICKNAFIHFFSCFYLDLDLKVAGFYWARRYVSMLTTDPPHSPVLLNRWYCIDRRQLN